MNEQKWPNHLVIVRHGESERNVLKEAAKLSGRTESFSDGIRDMDTLLTEEGGWQALRTGKFLASRYEFDAAFSSPYHRAVKTTERILQAYEVRPPVIQEERLRELEFGMFDGLTWDAVKSRNPDEYHLRQREGKYWYRPPGGENRPDVALRVHSFLGTITRDYRAKNVLVVSHSVVVLIFRRLLERWDEARYLQIDSEDDVMNCSVTAYRYDPVASKLVLDTYNEKGHLLECATAE
jgi:broad specificity phosphatase PhoE